MKPLLITLIAATIALSCTQTPESFSLKTDEHTTTVYRGEQPLLSYVHSETPAPEGQNPLYKRSAYIHPLYSPGGEVLTRIQPEDHYHHYGIWNPWTHTHFGEDSVDFWNLALGQGTVRFAEYLDQSEKKDGAGFTTRHDHIYFNEDGSEGLAINELWNIMVAEITESSYSVDMNITLSTPLKEGITLEAYRYGGGLGFRATQKWGTDNSTILTSEGKTRLDADGTHGRWLLVEGESSVPAGRSGILFMSHPNNRAHPEPMRVWPMDQYEGKSNVFVEFCPIRHQEWVLEPGKSYTLKYRMVVFDGTLEADEANNYWDQYSTAK
jgi:hypothetical protein